MTYTQIKKTNEYHMLRAHGKMLFYHPAPETLYGAITIAELDQMAEVAHFFTNENYFEVLPREDRYFLQRLIDFLNCEEHFQTHA
jgi:hypothetical protein